MLDIFTYINNLNKNEKISFKSYCRSKSSKITEYEKLFDSISKNKIQNLSDLKLYIKNSTWQPKQLYNLKKILYLHLNQAFSQKNLHRSITIDLNDQLSDIENLYNQGLYDPAIDTLQAAAMRALDHELFHYFLNLHFWSQAIFIASHKKTNLPISEKKCLQILAEIQNLNLLYREIMDLRVKSIQPRSTKWLHEIQNFQSQINQIQPNKLQSQTAKKRHHEIKALLAYLLAESDTEYQHIQKAIAASQKITHFAQTHIYEYTHLLSRQLILSKKNEPHKYPQYQAEILALADTHPNKQLRLRIQKLCRHTELIRLLDKRDYRAGLQLIPQTLSFLHIYTQELIPDEQISFHYMIAYFQLACGEYIAALKQITFIINTYQRRTKPDLYGFTYILFLIVHFELGNATLLNHLGKNAYYYLQKKERLFKTEKLLILFFKKLNQKKITLSTEQMFLQLQKKLHTTLKNPYETKVLAYFDVTLWIQAKLQNSTMEQSITTPVPNI